MKRQRSDGHFAYNDSPITGQRVAEAKIIAAWQMRRDMTTAERMLWQRIRANRLNGLHFRRQQVIDGFIADFYCHAARLIVEVDGAVHSVQVDYDAERDRVLAAHNLRILRVTNEQIRNDLPTILAQIVTLCNDSALRRPTPTVAPPCF